MDDYRVMTMNPISAGTTNPAQTLIQRNMPQAPPLPLAGADAANAPSFKDFLVNSIQDVNSLQHQADQAVETLMTGGDADPAEVLTAVQKADLAFRMMMQMRNKMMQVYQEVKDIRV